MKTALSLISTIWLFFFTCHLQAQTDTEFWFVAPEISSGHNDSPIVLRISALSQAANVQISQPANPAFPVQNIAVAIGETQTVNLTPWQNIVENQPANTVLNYGLLIQSNVPVAAYYEVNAFNNPDIFALKGSNAKGTDFYTPFQTFFNNGAYTPIAVSGFDIVATENNTTVTITPAADLLGHPAGVPFNITLNRGQTYSCIAAGISAAAHPTGSRVTSDKQICITIKDDSMQNGSCRDAMGDQLIPTTVIGTEYIVMRGFLGSDEHAFVLAVTDGTEVNVNGNPVAVLNTGESFDISINQFQQFTYIQTSNPAYVLHIAGFGCEMGGAVLPSIQCTGSSTVYFTRSTSELFGLNIMVRNGSQNNFVLNGNAGTIPGSLFSVVPGTNNAWVAAQVSLSEIDVAVGVTSVLSNTASSNELFHLGIINGGASSGCRYGYFSDFAATNLGGNRTICSNDSVELDAGPNKDSYLWSTGATTQTITITDPGIYWVNTLKDGCAASDTVSVVNDTSSIDLGPDVSICGGSPVTISAGNEFINYAWTGGGTDSTLTVSQAGTYIVQATTLNGCIFRDTVVVDAQPVPAAPQLNVPEFICEGDDLELIPSGINGAVFWTGPQGFSSNNESIAFTNIADTSSGNYQVFQVVNNCPSETVSFNLNVEELPQPEIIGDTLICEGELSALFVENGPYDSILWSTNATTEAIVDLPAGIYWVNVTNGNCAASDTLEVIADEPVANFVVLPDTIVFLGTPFVFTDSSTQVSTPIISYFWDFDNGAFATDSSVTYLYPDTGEYAVVYTVINANECIDTVISNVYVIKDIIVPNAFSPNGDGINDFLVFKYLEVYPNSYLAVFNRWGNKLFESDNYQNDWDGAEHPSGTYFYVLQPGSTDEVFKGYLFLSRD